MSALKILNGIALFVLLLGVSAYAAEKSLTEAELKEKLQTQLTGMVKELEEMETVEQAKAFLQKYVILQGSPDEESINNEFNDIAVSLIDKQKGIKNEIIKICKAISEKKLSAIVDMKEMSISYSKEELSKLSANAPGIWIFKYSPKGDYFKLSEKHESFSETKIYNKPQTSGGKKKQREKYE